MDSPNVTAEPSDVRLALLRTAPLEGCSQEGALVSGQMLLSHYPAQCSRAPPKCRQPLRAVTHLAEALSAGGLESCQQGRSGTVAGEAHCASLGTAVESKVAVASNVADASVERSQVGLHSAANLRQGCVHIQGSRQPSVTLTTMQQLSGHVPGPAANVQRGLVTHRDALPNA